MNFRGQVALTFGQFSYLKRMSSFRAVLSAASMLDDGRVAILLSVSQAETIRSELTVRHAEVGFDSDYELTEEGSILEALIDALYLDACEP